MLKTTRNLIKTLTIATALSTAAASHAESNTVTIHTNYSPPSVPLTMVLRNQSDSNVALHVVHKGDGDVLESSNLPVDISGIDPAKSYILESPHESMLVTSADGKGTLYSAEIGIWDEQDQYFEYMHINRTQADIPTNKMDTDGNGHYGLYLSVNINKEETTKIINSGTGVKGTHVLTLKEKV